MNGGQGQVMDLPLFDPLYSMLGPQAANYKLTGEVKVRTGSRSTNAAPRNVYQTKDGHWVCLSASTQGMAERVLVKIGRPELVEGSALRDQHRAGEERAGARPPDRRVRRRPRPRREPQVLRRGRRHHRPGLRHQPDHPGRLRAGARGADRDPRRADGRAADASGGAAPVRHARRDQDAGAQGRRAQRGAAEAAAGRGRVRQAEAGRSDQSDAADPARLALDPLRAGQCAEVHRQGARARRRLRAGRSRGQRAAGAEARGAGDAG